MKIFLFIFFLLFLVKANKHYRNKSNQSFLQQDALTYETDYIRTHSIKLRDQQSPFETTLRLARKDIKEMIKAEFDVDNESDVIRRQIR